MQSGHIFEENEAVSSRKVITAVNRRKIDIKDLTPVRGQDGKISDTQGKDFWSPTRLCRVGDQ
jgi:hypothetical protein